MAKEVSFDRPPLVVAPVEDSIWVLRLNSTGTKSVIDQVDAADFSVKSTHELANGNFISLGFAKATGHLWVGDKSGKVHVINPSGGYESVAVLEVSQKQISLIEAVPGDGSRIGTFDQVGQIHIWDAQSRAQVKSIRTQRTEIKSVAFSPDGNHLYSASTDQTVFHFDITEDKEVKKCLTRPHDTKNCNSIALNPNTMTLYSAGLDHVVRVWESSDSAW